MIDKVAGVNKAIIVNTLAVIIAAFITIIVHAVLPAGVNAENFDSVFVKLFGFPVVAVFYFILLFTHCVAAMRYLGRHSNVPKLQIGFRFGLAFAILYFFGMQEVAVEASPFSEWGFAFVSYQFFMGVGDAIPVLLLCVAVACLTLDNRNACLHVQTLSRTEKIKAVALIAAAFLAERVIGYETGIITSSCHTYPVPCYIWTVLFGIVMGCCYVVLYPVLAGERNKLLMSFKLAVLAIGVNWIIFNSFIGLIFSGVMLQMLLRSGIDAAILFLACIVIGKYFVKPDMRAYEHNLK